MEVPGILKLVAVAFAGGVAFVAAQQWSARAEVSQVIESIPRDGQAQTGTPVAAASGATPVASAAPPARAPATPGDIGSPDRAQALLATGARAFAVHSWLPPAPPPPPPPPPPPKVVAAPPPAPTAPALPFVFVGMLEKGLEQRPQAFLAKGDALLVVGAGDLLDNRTYRIETLTPQEVVMTYLPLDIKQTLLVSGGPK